MRLEQTNTSILTQSIQNQSLIKRFTRCVYSCLKCLLICPIKAIRFIWNIISQASTYIYRIIRSLLRSSVRKIQTIQAQRVQSEAIRFWEEEMFINRQFEVEVVYLGHTLINIEFLAEKWLAISLRDGISEKTFFEDLASLENKISSPRKTTVFNIIINSLISEHGQKMLTTSNRYYALDSRSSYNTTKNEMLNLVNFILDIEQKVNDFAEQHLKDLSQADRFKIIQKGLLYTDSLRPSKTPSLIIGRRSKYCLS